MCWECHATGRFMDFLTCHASFPQIIYTNFFSKPVLHRTLSKSNKQWKFQLNFTRTLRVSKHKEYFWQVTEYSIMKQTEAAAARLDPRTVCRSVVQQVYKHSLVELQSEDTASSSMRRLRYGKQALKSCHHGNLRMCVCITVSCGMWTDETVVQVYVLGTLILLHLLQISFFFLRFRRGLNAICSFLGNSPASEF